jgi:hypothetical protein
MAFQSACGALTGAAYDFNALMQTRSDARLLEAITCRPGESSRAGDLRRILSRAIGCDSDRRGLFRDPLRHCHGWTLAGCGPDITQVWASGELVTVCSDHQEWRAEHRDADQLRPRRPRMWQILACFAHAPRPQ